MAQPVYNILLFCPLLGSLDIATDDNRLFQHVSPRAGDGSIEQQHPHRRC